MFVASHPIQTGERAFPVLSDPYNWVSWGPALGGEEPGYMEAQITCHEPLVENSPKS